MTRPGKPSRGQAVSDLFASDAEEAVLRVLREADAALTAGEVKKALQAGGVARADTDKAWPGIQEKIRWHDHVVVERGHRYRWTTQPHVFSSVEALELLTNGSLPAAKRTALVAIARTGFASPPVSLDEIERLRYAEIDAVRALAELAIEVEGRGAHR